MANIVYNQFLLKMSGEGIDLTEENKYKICLLKSDTPEAIKTPSYGGSYIEIAQGGWECEDLVPSQEESKGYPEGGKYINLICQPQDSYTEYYGTNIIFREVTFDSINAARYALIYKEDTGLPISLFDLGEDIEVDNDSVILNWGNVAILRIGSVDISHLLIDDKLSSNSTFAVQNKVVTEALKRYGIILDDDKTPDEQGDFPEGSFEALDGMDEMKKITEDEINNWDLWLNDLVDTP